MLELLEFTTAQTFHIYVNPDAVVITDGDLVAFEIPINYWDKVKQFVDRQIQIVEIYG